MTRGVSKGNNRYEGGKQRRTSRALGNHSGTDEAASKRPSEFGTFDMSRDFNGAAGKATDQVFFQGKTRLEP